VFTTLRVGDILAHLFLRQEERYKIEAWKGEMEPNLAAVKQE
jgi:hypothetical protein